MIFPQPRFEPLVTITPFSMESTGGGVTNNTVAVNSATSGTWPTANTAYFFPFLVGKRITVQQFFLMNGATAAGNVDMGVYTLDGVRVVSAGSTAQAGTNAIQALSITPTQLTSGQFYLAIAMSSTSATIFKTGFVVTPHAKMSGMAQMASAFPLPATATLATSTNNMLPLIALTTRSVI